MKRPAARPQSVIVSRTNNEMNNNWIALDDRCPLLPALFIGAVSRRNIQKLPTPEEFALYPDYIVGISHKYEGHAIQSASGVGLLLPLGVSPLNGPLVDVLRIFSGWNTDYFGVSDAARARNEKEGTPYTWSTRIAWETILAVLELKHPNLKGLKKDFYPKFRYVGGGAWDPLTEESRNNLNELIARFVKLPPVAEGSVEALIEFESTIEQSVMGWPCLSRKNPASCYPVVAEESLEALKTHLANFQISSFLLWENSD